MSYTRRETVEIIQELRAIRTVLSAYNEISALWMSRTRDAILHNRDYQQHITAIFFSVFAAYARKIKQTSLTQKLLRRGQITFLAHNGKKVAVLLGANTGLFGEVLRNTLMTFLNDVRHHNYEVVIVGRRSLQLFLAEEPGRPYTFFDLPDEKVDQEQLMSLIRHLVQYEEIRIYHGLFHSIVSQESTVLELEADPMKELAKLEANQPPPDPNLPAKDYLFEPTLEAILVFFEKQFFTSVFAQTLRESQLAKYASRLVATETASQNIRHKLKNLVRENLRLNHQHLNKKQLNQVTTLRQWYASQSR